MSGDPDTIREITARAQAVVEQECDMGDDGGPCDDCLAQRALRDDSLWLLDRLAAVEAQRDELARALQVQVIGSLLEIRRAAFRHEIGVRYTEAIRLEIADECRKLEDAALAALTAAGDAE